MDISRIMGVLGHEMRTPLAAILGYYELLAEGIYGDIDQRQTEPVQRIGQSAHQLLALIDGLQELATGNRSDDEEAEPFDAAATLRTVRERIDSYAASRNVHIELDTPASFLVNGVESRFARVFDMVLAAAIKTSSGSTIHVHLDQRRDAVGLAVDGTGLDLQRDNPAQVTESGNGNALTGAALRLAIAEQAARLAGGQLTLARLNGHVCVTVEFPADSTANSAD